MKQYRHRFIERTTFKWFEYENREWYQPGYNSYRVAYEPVKRGVFRIQLMWWQYVSKIKYEGEE
jgi:hypothetical protein